MVSNVYSAISCRTDVRDGSIFRDESSSCNAARKRAVFVSTVKDQLYRRLYLTNSDQRAMNYDDENFVWGYIFFHSIFEVKL